MLLKKPIFITLMLFSVISVSQDQELDKAYLDSLPESVKEDVLKEIKNQKNDETNNVYKRPSTTLKKYETIKKWEEFLRKSEIAPSQRFGSQIFQSMQSSFMPLNLPNFDSSYVLDYGDILEIQLIGQKSKKYKIEVGRDGTVSLPEMEKINVAGLSLEQANNAINTSLNSSFLGTQASITLKEVRDIQILLTGEVEFPGIYILSGNSNLLHALNVSGGITENGSYREVEIRRNGKLVRVVDLYEILVEGRTSFNSSLKSGDTILVKNALNIVRISGGVNRSAKYELKSNESLSDLLYFANDLSFNFSDEGLIFETIRNNSIITSIIQLNELGSINPKSGDSLYIPFNTFREIELTGQIRRPGRYTITDGETLSSLISRAGGYKDEAYPFGGLLTRQSIKDIEKKNHERLYKDLIEALATDIRSQAMSEASQALPALLMELKEHVPSGRIQVEFDEVTLQNNPYLDTELHDKDKIHIPSMQKVVHVYGEIMNPGSISFKSGEDLNYYIEKAGNYSFYSDVKYAVVVSPDGSAHSINYGFLNKSDVELYPGSLIYIPRKIGQYDGISLVSIISPIFSAFALSLASVNALND